MAVKVIAYFTWGQGGRKTWSYRKDLEILTIKNAPTERRVLKDELKL